MPFQINGSSPPTNCEPSAQGYRWKEPQPSGYDGYGHSVGAAGKPSVVLTFTTLSPTGWNWYLAILSGAESVDLTSAQLWNPYKSGGAGWQTYSTSGILHKPKFATFEYGAYRGVEMLISELS